MGNSRQPLVARFEDFEVNLVDRRGVEGGQAAEGAGPAV